MQHTDTQKAANMSEAVNSDLLLTREELAELTGTCQAARQRRWLQDRRWPFIEALGRNSYPRVSRALALNHLHGVEVGMQPKKPELNLAALEAKVTRRAA